MEGIDRRTADLITAGIYAGAYGRLAREMPEAAGGFERLLQRHKAHASALMAEIAATALQGPARAR